MAERYHSSRLYYNDDISQDDGSHLDGLHSDGSQSDGSQTTLSQSGRKLPSFASFIAKHLT